MTTLHDAISQKIASNTKYMTHEEARYWVENDAICSAGSVVGLIYYDETSAFYDTHEEAILDLARDCDFDCSVIEHGMTGFKNIMAWFAFEALKDCVFEGMDADIWADKEAAS